MPLCMIGPPQPAFHVVNATHIEVEWDKSFALTEYDVRNYLFALPEYDVRNYTLLIINTISTSHVFLNQSQVLYTVSEYPTRHSINMQWRNHAG